ncbi:MAG: M48 family metalloprotease [Robiginitomaculum sp.]
MNILRQTLSKILLSCVLLIVSVAGASPAFSQSLLRDTEIEETLRVFTDPLLKAAHLSTSSVNLYLVNDNSLNAFVTGGQNIFIHTGLILEAETPNQLKGVIAHETGHIAGGHLARRDHSNRSAYGSMLIAAGLGIAAMLAGESAAGAAILMGSKQFGTLNVLANSRVNEASADQAAAKYLEATGQSAQGLVDFFEKFRYQEVLSQARRYPYFRGHPLSSERIDKLREVISESKFANVKETEENHKRLAMAQAKIIGFIDAPQTVFNKYPPGDNSQEARYARSIALYRGADLKGAILSIDSLIREEPKNPYFYELKGQILFESGKGAQAIIPLRQAHKLKPDAPLIEIALAQALLANETPENVDLAIRQLKSALRKENNNSFAWYTLSRAYELKNMPALARYAIAEQAFNSHNYERARGFATRAQQEGLTPYPPQARRASDIIIISATQIASHKGRRR